MMILRLINKGGKEFSSINGAEIVGFFLRRELNFERRRDGKVDIVTEVVVVDENFLVEVSRIWDVFFFSGDALKTSSRVLSGCCGCG